MAHEGRVYQEVREIVHLGLKDGVNGAEVAVLHSKLREASEADLYSLLAEFFDIELVVEAIYEQFTVRGREWSTDLRQKLAEALIFCGMDHDAEEVLASGR